MPESTTKPKKRVQFEDDDATQDDDDDENDDRDDESDLQVNKVSDLSTLDEDSVPFFSSFDFLIITVMFVYLLVAPYTKVEESFILQAVHDIVNYGVFDLSKYDHNTFPGAVPRTFISPLILAAFVKPLSIINNLYNKHVVYTQLNVQFITRAVVLLTNAASLIYLRYTAQKTDQYWMNNNNSKVVQLEKDNGSDEKTTTKDKSEDKKNEDKKTVSAKSLKKGTGFNNINNLAPSSSIGIWFTLFTMSQFHIIYYSSRTLPNFVMSLPISNIAMSWCLNGNYGCAITLLSFGGIVFRMELGVLCLALSLVWYLNECKSHGKGLIQISLLKKIFKWILYGVSLGSFLSLQIDSYFWSKWTVPEVESFIFNILYGQSSNWGTEPITAYFTKYLLMIFIPPTVLFLNYLGMQTSYNNNLRLVWFSSILFIAIMSLQPHKEWRFIIYAIPPITLVGAAGASTLFTTVDYKDNFGYIVPILVSLSPVVSLCISLIFMYISSANYPGGQALQIFNDYIVEHNITNKTIHMDVPSCMTGVSLFGELESDRNITYDKLEDQEFLTAKWQSFDYIMGTFAEMYSTDEHIKYHLIGKAQMFDGINREYVASLGEKYFSGLDIIQEMIKYRSLEFFHDFANNIFVYSDAIYIWEREPIEQQN
ncbi:hypothetical protein ACO0QE_000813 [Hanseniaspora vineae]